jgi:uncharacterized damage-inducible protein DinB
MKPDELVTLFDYAWWARDRLLAAADGMTDEEFGRDNGFTYKSIRGILVHALEAEMIWFNRFLGEGRPEPIGESITSAEALKARWAPEEKAARGFLSGLTEATLAEDFVTRRRTGEENRTPLWVLLTHVVTHGAQHRSEAAEALTMVGRSPGSLDFVTYFWERPVG